jgi:hypothetical protein
MYSSVIKSFEPRLLQKCREGYCKEEKSLGRETYNAIYGGFRESILEHQGLAKLKDSDQLCV